MQCILTCERFSHSFKKKFQMLWHLRKLIDFYREWWSFMWHLYTVYLWFQWSFIDSITVWYFYCISSMNTVSKESKTETQLPSRVSRLCDINVWPTIQEYCFVIKQCNVHSFVCMTYFYHRFPSHDATTAEELLFTHQLKELSYSLYDIKNSWRMDLDCMHLASVHCKDVLNNFMTKMDFTWCSTWISGFSQKYIIPTILQNSTGVSRLWV